MHIAACLCKPSTHLGAAKPSERGVGGQVGAADVALGPQRREAIHAVAVHQGSVHDGVAANDEEMDSMNEEMHEKRCRRQRRL